MMQNSLKLWERFRNCGQTLERWCVQARKLILHWRWGGWGVDSHWQWSTEPSRNPLQSMQVCSKFASKTLESGSDRSCWLQKTQTTRPRTVTGRIGQAASPRLPDALLRGRRAQRRLRVGNRRGHAEPTRHESPWEKTEVGCLTNTQQPGNTIQSKMHAPHSGPNFTKQETQCYRKNEKRKPAWRKNAARRSESFVSN